ncbi:MAG: hypothetical protein HY815_31255 [Candidatus Riflebacteria bacterium]|nr:hypothetical protein [Candidatus Riflebacteria bacterium]
MDRIDPERWVDEHGDGLYRYALARLRNPTQAEDVVQETFVTALHARESYGGRSTERTWLTGILRHRIIDRFRRQWREQPVSALDPADAQDAALDGLFDERGMWLRDKPQPWLDPPGVDDRGGPDSPRGPESSHRHARLLQMRRKSVSEDTQQYTRRTLVPVVALRAAKPHAPRRPPG